jgi:hypothetical protein
MWVLQQKTLLWVLAFDAWVRIPSTYSSPMLQVNCPSCMMLAPPPLAVLEPTPWITPHYSHKHMRYIKQAKDDVGTSELFWSDARNFQVSQEFAFIYCLSLVPIVH